MKLFRGTPELWYWDEHGVIMYLAEPSKIRYALTWRKRRRQQRIIQTWPKLGYIRED